MEGWITLPFYSFPVGGERPNFRFASVGVVESDARAGGQGLLGIPIPPGASRVVRVRIVGEFPSANPSAADVEVILSRNTVGKSTRQLVSWRQRADASQHVKVDESLEIASGEERLTTDSSLSLQVSASGLFRVHLVGVQFAW